MDLLDKLGTVSESLFHAGQQDTFLERYMEYVEAEEGDYFSLKHAAAGSEGGFAVKMVGSVDFYDSSRYGVKYIEREGSDGGFVPM